MRTSKDRDPSPEDHPPPYSSISTSQPQPQPDVNRARLAEEEERTPLLSPYQYQHPNRSQTASQSSENWNGDPHPQHELHPQPRLQRWISHPLYRLPTIPQAQRNKICRLLLLALLTLSILGTLFQISGLAYIPFHPPGPYLPPDTAPVRVAIIGAGPAGVGAAVRLSELFPKGNVNAQGKGKGKREKEVELQTVVFERKSHVGGRMNLDLSLDLFPAGGKVQIEDVAHANLFSEPEGMVRRRAEDVLGLSFEPEEKKGIDQEVGFLDGNGVISQVTRPRANMSWTQWASLLWRYGTSFLRASSGSLYRTAIQQFNTMLSLASSQTFNSVENWVDKAGLALKNSLETSAGEKLKLAGIVEADKYRTGILESQIRRQTGQGIEEISALSLSLALAREEAAGARGARIESILEKFLEKSGAELRPNTNIDSMEREHIPVLGKKEAGWRLFFNGQSEVFDLVILTTPWTPREKAYYRHIWHTFILSSSSLKPQFFNATELPDQLLCIPNSGLGKEIEGIKGIGFVRDVFSSDIDAEVNTQSVYKLYRILSSSPLSEEMIEKMWGADGEIKRVAKVRDELAYPLLFPRSSGEGLGKFRVEEKVWNTAVVESVGMGVDLSWAAGENVAGLIGRELELGTARLGGKMMGVQ